MSKAVPESNAERPPFLFGGAVATKLVRTIDDQGFESVYELFRECVYIFC